MLRESLSNGKIVRVSGMTNAFIPPLYTGRPLPCLPHNHRLRLSILVDHYLAYLTTTVSASLRVAHYLAHLTTTVSASLRVAHYLVHLTTTVSAFLRVAHFLAHLTTTVSVCSTCARPWENLNERV